MKRELTKQREIFGEMGFLQRELDREGKFSFLGQILHNLSSLG